MAELKIDEDGEGYFDQYTGTHLRYGFNWWNYASVIGATIVSTTVSCSLSDVTYGSTAISSAYVHTVHVNASNGNAGQEPMLVSKVFFSDGQSDKARFRIKITD